ncbi:hypothetical protein ACLB2K_012243 [Fragaria x ananassa]
MLVACEFAAAGVVDGRVYVIGGCVTDSWTGRSVGLRFDPSTGCWEAVANPVEVQGKWMHINAMIGGRVYTLANRDGIRGFDAKNRVWKEFKGVEKKLLKFLCGATMANVGETGLNV